MLSATPHENRYPETPERVVYEWNPQTTEFRTLNDLLSQVYCENWETALTNLIGRTEAATPSGLLADWPVDQTHLSQSQLYGWLNHAFEERRIRREGTGRKRDPYRFSAEAQSFSV